MSAECDRNVSAEIGFQSRRWADHTDQLVPGGSPVGYSAYGAAGVPPIFLVSLQTLNARPLSPAPECLAAEEPAFSPDGKQLALACIPARRYTPFTLA